MLKRKFRLTKRGSFSYVYRKGRSVRTRNISLIFTAGKDAPRIGFSVNNKVGHAVVRNKLKRRMRAVIGKLIADVAPCQAVFAVRPNAGGMTFDQIEKELTELLIKGGLLTKENGKEKN